MPMSMQFFETVPPISFDRAKALGVLYAHAALEVAGWAKVDKRVEAAFAPDERVLAKLPARVAEEIRVQLHDDNSITTLRQFVRGAFYDARKAAEERSLAALTAAIRDRTVANHASSLHAKIAPSDDLSSSQRKIVASGAEHALAAARKQGPDDVSQIAVTRLTIADMPAGITAYRAADGIYLKDVSGEHFWIGPLPPEKRPSGANPPLTKQLSRVIQELVRDRVDHAGDGYWELLQPPVDSMARLPRVKIDPDDLLGPRRDAFLIGGHLYATREQGDGHRWYYVGPLPKDAADRVVSEPTLTGHDEAAAYVAAHPTPDPAPTRDTAWQLDRGSAVAHLDARLLREIDERKDLDLALLQQTLTQLRANGVKSLSVFPGNTRADSDTIARAGLDAIQLLVKQLGAGFVDRLPQQGVADIRTPSGTTSVLVCTGTVDERKAQALEALKPWGGEEIVGFELNLAVDPVALRTREIRRYPKDWSLSGTDMERMARVAIESYAYSGPTELRLTNRPFRPDEKLSAGELNSKIVPILERAAELKLIEGFAILPDAEGFVCTIPPTLYAPPT